MTTSRASALRLGIVASALLCAASAFADPRPLGASEHDEIVRVLRSFFDATRDSDTRALASVLPSDTEFRRIFMPGTEPLVERHRRAVARALDDLHTRFSGGVFTGLRGFDTGTLVRSDRCSPFAMPQSECLDGPVIEWTVHGETRRMRISKLVRVDGHWRVFAPRL